jgi:hypothetical protein
MLARYSFAVSVEVPRGELRQLRDLDAYSISIMLIAKFLVISLFAELINGSLLKLIKLLKI